MFELRRRLALEFWNNALGEHLAQFDAPLVERIDVPNYALRENAVLIERDEFAEDFRRQPVGQDDIGRTVALKNPMRHKRRRRALGFDFLWRLAKGQRFGLGENIGQKNVVVTSQAR